MPLDPIVALSDQARQAGRPALPAGSPDGRLDAIAAIRREAAE